MALSPMKRSPAAKHPQRGIALITAMLVTAIAATAAVNMASRQQIDLRRSENLFGADQGYLFALGVESWAIQILRRDIEDNKVDSLDEDWAVTLPPIAVEGAVLSGGIEDLQGRYNLNNLVKDGKVSEPDVKRFKRLLKFLEIDEGVADAVIDWIDSDASPSIPDGAEDVDYLLLSPGYRAANAPLVSPSELLLIKGIDRTAFDKLEPYVQCVPERTPINVNTAPPAVLMMLADGLSQSDAEQIRDDRADKHFKSTGEFLDLSVIKGLGQDITDISVASHYFMVKANTEYEHSRVRTVSVLARSDTGQVQTLSRSQGGY